MHRNEVKCLRALALGLALAAAAGMAAAQDNAQGGAQGGQGRFGLRISDDQPIQIESDKLEVRDADNVAVFTGNVHVVQGPTVIRAGSMVVHYAGDGSPTSGTSDIERIEVDDKVFVKSESQTATGDQGTFDLQSEVLTLTGDKVVLTEGQTVIVGCKLTVQMQTGLANLDGCGGAKSEGGRVKMLLQPESKN